VVFMGLAVIVGPWDRVTIAVRRRRWGSPADRLDGDGAAPPGTTTDLVRRAGTTVGL